MKSAIIIDLASYLQKPTIQSPCENNDHSPPSEELGNAIQLLIQQLRESSCFGV